MMDKGTGTNCFHNFHVIKKNKIALTEVKYEHKRNKKDKSINPLRGATDLCLRQFYFQIIRPTYAQLSIFICLC